MKTLFKTVMLVCILAACAYTVYTVYRLSERVQKIENKLGGPGKIACNEKDTIAKVRRSVVRIVGGEGEGSGFAMQKGGYILTNFHVIEAEPSPKVVLPDNTFETARVILADKNADLAVVKIDRDLPALKLAPSDMMSPGEELLAIGFPLGGSLPGASSVSRGVFSRFVDDKKNRMRYLNTDMTMVDGISGGPMVNICGDVVGVNTFGLLLGGMGIAISSESVRDRCRKMAMSKTPLKDVKRIAFEPEKGPLEAVQAFYNYLKVRKLEKAFELLSDNFVRGYSFEHWAKGYKPLLDTTIIMINPAKRTGGRIYVKLSTKDLEDNEITYKYFEGYWDVRNIKGKWLLWHPRIRQVEDPYEEWFNIPQEILEEAEAFNKANPDFEEYEEIMGEIASLPGNEGLSLQEIYDKAKETAGKQPG